ILDVRNLEVQFINDEKVTTAVDNISFQLTKGQTLGIVGESGSGKSVTALATIGLISEPGKISGGEIWFQNAANNQNVNLLKLSSEEKRLYRGKEIAMIFQEPMSSLNPVFTCGFQLIEAITLHQDISSEADGRRRAIALLQEVKLLPSDQDLIDQYLTEFAQKNPGQETPPEKEIYSKINEEKLAILKKYPHEFSGGQLQRIMIAMALACNPSILIADEPTTALDVTVQKTILELLKELKNHREMSMLFITHDLGIIAEIADMVAVMYQGQIVEYGTVQDIFNLPQHSYTQGLLYSRPRLDKKLRKLPTVADFLEGTERIKIQASLDNEISEVELNERIRELANKRPILSVKNLQVGFPIKGIFGEKKRYYMAVNGVSFDIYPGETVGLVGESGCGKTTLARTLIQLIKPLSGEIVFENKLIDGLGNEELYKLKREMQIIFQNPFSALNPRMKVGDAIMEPLLIHGINNYKKRKERAIYLLERVGLDGGSINRYPHQFSGGQRQRICIARA
ncbi:MAG TPA: ABC transporter ATP-binding protein, partial [Allocoleopsis sp.]